MKYRKKPVEVEAFRLSRDVDMIAPKWFTQAVIDEKVFIDRSINDGKVHIYGCTVINGNERYKAKIGDYVIREPNGKICTCKAKEFKKMYEKAF